MTEHLLSINLLIAFAGLVFITLTKRVKTTTIKTAATIVSGLQLWIGFEIIFNFNPLETALQFSERIKWIAALRIDYYIGIDSINLVFLSLTSLLVFLSVLIFWKNEHRVKEYFVLLMMVNIGLTGTFAAMNLFLFFVFLGITFFAVYLIIGIWTGPNGSNPANRLGVYILLGYILILLGLILLLYENHLHSLNLSELISGNTMSSVSQMIISIIFMLGFAFLIPIFPFHSWLIPVIKKTPVGLTVLVISIMTKIGLYGLIRIIAPVMPVAANTLALGIAIWGLLNIIYGAICALGSSDTDQILGYYTLQQTGFILIGFAAITGGAGQNIPAAVTGLSGALLIAASHAALIALLLIILKKYVPDSINALAVSPGLRPVIILTLLGGLGMPGLSDFIARFTTILGAYQIPRLNVITIISLFGLIANFIVFQRLFRRMIFNQVYSPDQPVVTFDTNEMFVIVILLSVIILLGLFPGFLLNILKAGLIRMVEMFSTAVAL